MKNIPSFFLKMLVMSNFLLVSATSSAVQFMDIAEGDNAGITYRSQKTDRDAIFDALKAQPVLLPTDMALAPNKSRGNPGLAIFDYDMDGDLDILVTNSSETGVNSLYANQLIETGKTVFIDKAAEAGLDLPETGSVGLCFGDIDNDGDKDVYVTGLPTSVMMENNGDGTFTNIAKHSHTETSGYYPAICSFGDVNGDGLLDLVVGNSYDNWNHRLPLVLFEYSHLMQPNLLFINSGDNEFEDKSAESGIQNVARISWAIGLVDYDLDGDLDLVVGDDQGPKLPAKFGGQDYGYLRFYENDGKGNFQDVTEKLKTNRYGGWMGISFADYNRDGILDFFATNAGDYVGSMMPPTGGEWQSAWFIGQQDGTYKFPGLGAMGSSLFGWSTTSIDYDNDGDTDIYYAGGLDMVTMVGSNPGVILKNDGAANFSWDQAALPDSEYHKRRNVQGSASGDLNNDGFIDIVNVSNMNWPQNMPLMHYPPLGGVFDGFASFWATFRPVDPTDMSQGFIWNGVDPTDGTLSIHINSADNNNNWIKVKPMGGIGLVDDGKVNRDGIGAVISFQPKNGEKVMLPIASGLGHNSSNALETVFGLGAMHKGDLEVLWPGGVRNKLYNVMAGEQIVFPEIPCSYKSSEEFKDYRECVAETVDDLVDEDVLDKHQARRFYSSAVKAYHDFHKDKL